MISTVADRIENGTWGDDGTADALNRRAEATGLDDRLPRFVPATSLPRYNRTFYRGTPVG
jgi:hypothetical protein